MTMAASRQLRLSTLRLFETRWSVACTSFVACRGLVVGALYLRNCNLTKSNTCLKWVSNGFMRWRSGLKEVLDCTRVDGRWEERSRLTRKTQRAEEGGVLGHTPTYAKWAKESWFPTLSSARGRGAIWDVTSECVKCRDDRRALQTSVFIDSGITSSASHGLGGVTTYGRTSLKRKHAGFVRSFNRTCSTEVKNTSRRSRNLEIYGQNYATNQRVLSEIVRIIQKDTGLEVVRLGESCHVRLVVRTPGSDLFLGISAKAAKMKDIYGCFRFSQCRKDKNILNLCASLPSLVNNSFRWWLIPGEQLAHLASDRLNLYPKGKWGRFEISENELGDAILRELDRRIAYQVPLSKWSVPKAPTHQKELDYFLQMTRKVWMPLGCDVANPLIDHSSVDAVIDSVRVQIKTSCAHKGSRGLRINIRKQGGRDGCGKRTIQPYSIDDGIDAIIVNVQQRKALAGLFIFPKKEVISRGWFRGNYHPGKVAVHVFPPSASPRKGYESVQQWQLQYYLDVSHDVDLDRAKMLLDQCKNEK